MDRFGPTSTDVFTERVTWLRHLAAQNVVRTLLLALDSIGVPCLLVKGILTAHILYDDPASRPIRDVDVRIRRRDFERAVRLAQARGWRTKRLVLLGQDLWRVEGMEIDIKSALGPPGLCAISVDDLVDRATPCVKPFDFPFLAPELTDHALILVLNVFKDGFRTAPWAIEDLRRIVRHEDFVSRALIGRAATGGVLTALWLVADWLAEGQNVLEWRALRDQIGPRPPSRRVARMYALWRRAGCPRRVGHFVIPTENDDPRHAMMGIGYAGAGIVRGYGLRALDWVRG